MTSLNGLPASSTLPTAISMATSIHLNLSRCERVAYAGPRIDLRPLKRSSDRIRFLSPNLDLLQV
jgi:hypothetical protein